MHKLRIPLSYSGLLIEEISQTNHQEELLDLILNSIEKNQMNRFEELHQKVVAVRDINKAIRGDPPLFCGP